MSQLKLPYVLSCDLNKDAQENKVDNMEISSEKEDALRLVLGQHPIGISADALFSKCEVFEDRADLAKCLHLAKNQGWIHSKDGKHFLVTLAKDFDTTAKPTASVVETPAAPKEVVVEQPAVLTTVIETSDTRTVDASPAFKSGALKSDRLPFGDLHRSRSLGAAALALFKWRAESALTLDDLVEITGAKKTSLYSVMTKLVELGYADKNDADFRCPYFKWSGVFAYPFVKMLETDNELLAYSTPLKLAQSKLPKIEVQAVEVKAEPAAVQSAPDFKHLSGLDEKAIEVPAFRTQSFEVASASGAAFKANNIELLVKQIDLEIANYRRQIDMLTTMRNLVAPVSESQHV